MKVTKQDKLNAINYLADNEIKLWVTKDFHFDSSGGVYIFCKEGDIIFYSVTDKNIYLNIRSQVDPFGYFDIKLDDAWKLLGSCTCRRE